MKAATNFTSASGITTAERIRGQRAAIAMIARLERSRHLNDSCDPDCDEPPVPLRNIVAECLTKVAKDCSGDAFEGFCSVLSAFIAASVDGGGGTARWLRRAIPERERKVALAIAASRDAGLQAFLASVQSARPA